jgi:hypothetical protein
MNYNSFMACQELLTRGVGNDKVDATNKPASALHLQRSPRRHSSVCVCVTCLLEYAGCFVVNDLDVAHTPDAVSSHCGNCKYYLQLVAASAVSVCTALGNLGMAACALCDLATW